MERQSKEPLLRGNSNAALPATGAAAPKLFWLVSAPHTKQGTLAAQKRKTEQEYNLAANYIFSIPPDLKPGTLDSLLSLSEDLAKIDTFVESVVKKVARQVFDLVEKRDSATKQDPERLLTINGASPAHYLVQFSWDEAKYPATRATLKELTTQIAQDASGIDESLRTKSLDYNAINQSIMSSDRKTEGNLLSRNLADIVKSEHWLDTEYMTTLFVVVPKHQAQEWEKTYTSINAFVVPDSTKKMEQDNEYALYSVVVFKTYVNEFVPKARNLGFKVRDFKYEPTSTGTSNEAKKKMTQEREEQYGALLNWCKVHFGEIFSSWVHLKAIRLFVESALRYGLPVNFEAMIVLPKKGNEKKLLKILSDHYRGLATNQMGLTNATDEEGSEQFYPFVFLQMNLDFRVNA